MWYVMGGVMMTIALGGLGLRTVTRRFNVDLARVHDGPLTQRTQGRHENDVCWSCDVSPAKSALGLCKPCEVGLLPRA